jgi:hypothetical protein
METPHGTQILTADEVIMLYPQSFAINLPSNVQCTLENISKITKKPTSYFL